MMNEGMPPIGQWIDGILGSMGYLSPELLLGAGFLICIIADLAFSKRFRSIAFWVSLITLLFSAAAVVADWGQAEQTLFGGMLKLGQRAMVFKLLLVIASVLFALFVKLNSKLREHEKGTGDLFAVLLAIQIGMNMMVMSNNLLMFYLSLEMVSVGSYIMVAYQSAHAKQTEAAMKYALFGAVSSAMMLYGISLLYGFTGTLYIDQTGFTTGLGEIEPLALTVALILVLAGICFKLSLVPFHFWAPDVYEGAPTPVTAFLATAPKVAGFGLLINFIEIFNSNDGLALSFPLNEILMVLAIAGMIVGNFGAIWQNNVKRMLAYSAIGHTGFLLMALLAFNDFGFRALFFYLLIYIIMNMAAFMLADQVEEDTGAVDVNTYKGLGKQRPYQMILFVIVLVSLTGLPPTAGFTAKFLVFSSALEFYSQGGSILALGMIAVAAISTVVSLFYYFKIPLYAFLREPEKEYGPLKPFKTGIIVSILVSLLFLLILYPGLITRWL